MIERLRLRVGRGEARPPSTQTMYRWFAEARWRARAGPEAATAAAAAA